MGSGRIDVSDAVIDGASSFSAGSGNVTVVLAESPAADLTISTGSGKAVLRYRGYPIEGYFEFTALQSRGKIVSPFGFDDESTFTQDGRTYMRKSFTLEKSDPKVTIRTGSGTAELKK